MPQYKNAQAELAPAKEQQTSAAFEAGTHAREEGDRYPPEHGAARDGALPDGPIPEVQGAQRPLGLLVLCGVLLAIALYFIVTYPRA